MGSYGELYVGNLQVASMKNKLYPELLSVFTDDMYHSRTTEAAEYYVDTEPGSTVMVHEFIAPGQIIADRLDILGFTPKKARQVLDSKFEKARNLYAIRASDGTSGELSAGIDTDECYLRDYAAEDWIADLRSAAISRQAENTHAPGSIEWLMFAFEEEDERSALRAVLLARPGDQVRLDVTDLVAGGWLDEPPSGICAKGLSTMRAVAAIHAPIVVLTEGKSDIAVLEPALRILYPHLSDLIRFMDYGERPPGGAGSLVNMVRSFAAAGIANRVVALFDNDTAATDALRLLDQARLPDNIRVLQYPSIDLARNYPTLGPPPTDVSVTNADVNGLAGSIEIYLGRDILTLPDGTLRPVQWRSYINSIRQYQGEILDKERLHSDYRAKIHKAEIDPSQIAQQDWSGIRAILNLALEAFRPN